MSMCSIKKEKNPCLCYHKCFFFHLVVYSCAVFVCSFGCNSISLIKINKKMLKHKDLECLNA